MARIHMGARPQKQTERAAIELLRQYLSGPATLLARRIKSRSFALADYNRAARLAGDRSYKSILAVIRRYDARRANIAGAFLAPFAA